MKRLIWGIFIVFCFCFMFSCTRMNNSKLTWDFTKKKVYFYSYSKEQDNKNKTGINNQWEKKHMLRKGNFYIQSTNHQLANLLYPNSLTTLELYDEKTKSYDTMTFLSNGFAKYNLSPNGSFIDSDSLILFPQFSKKLEKGNKDTLPTYFKFDLPEAKILATGYNTLECFGDTTYDNRKCVIIKGKIEVSDIVSPKDYHGDLKFIRTGNAMYYFDKENHCYVGANINLVDNILIFEKAKSVNDSNFYCEIQTIINYKIQLDEIKRDVAFDVVPAKIE